MDAHFTLAELATLFSPSELAEIRAYYGPIYANAALSPFIELGLSLLILRFTIRPLWAMAGAAAQRTSARLAWMRTAPVARALVGAIEKLWGGPGYGQALWFAGLQFWLSWLIAMPRSFYFGWIHEARFGLTHQSAWEWAWRVFKGGAVAALAMALLASGLFALARRTRRWWLLLGLGSALALTISGAFDPYRGRLYFDQEPLPQGPLRERLTAVLAKAEVPYRELWVRKTSVASKRVQAYFAGQGPTRSIVFNDVLLDQFSAEEVVAVIAHEAAHIHEPKWPGRLAAAVMVLLLLLGADRVLRLSARRGWFGTNDFGDLRNLPLLLFLYWLVVLPFGPASNAISRSRELAADAYAVELTGDPDTFRSMLIRAARINKEDPTPPAWVVILGYSHPTLAQRLGALPTAPTVRQVPSLAVEPE